MNATNAKREPERPVVRPRRAHTLKTWPQFIDPLGTGEKTFECRQNDRDFQVGDILHLREWYPDTRQWGPRSITCFVTYLMDGPRFGLEKGYCIMAIRLPANHQWPNAEVSHRRHHEQPN